MPGSSSMQHCPPVRYNTFRKRGGRLDFDSPCLAEAEYRRRGNGITGAVVPAKRTPRESGSKLPLGPGHSTRVNTSGSTARCGHPTRDLGAKPQPNTPPAK